MDFKNIEIKSAKFQIIGAIVGIIAAIISIIPVINNYVTIDKNHKIKNDSTIKHTIIEDTIVQIIEDTLRYDYKNIKKQKTKLSKKTNIIFPEDNIKQKWKNQIDSQNYKIKPE